MAFFETHFPTEWPRWAMMWELALAIYAGLKFLTWKTSKTRAAAWKQTAYLLAWPGMDADAFLGAPVDSVRRPSLGEWIFALAKLSLGLALSRMAIAGVEGDNARLWAWIGGVGIVFILHFGLFHLLSCVWRRVGRPAIPLMNWPIAAESLAEFWGRRWNLAFRDVTHRFLFRPLRRRWGATAALLSAFLISGLVHDLVISVPAGGGWGLPTLYFLIQGFSLLAERSTWGRSAGLGRGIEGRVFCAAVLLVPIPLLFHDVFIDCVLIPFLRALGSFW